MRKLKIYLFFYSKALLLFPATIMHESMHLIVAILTFSRITDISIFPKIEWNKENPHIPQQIVYGYVVYIPRFKIFNDKHLGIKSMDEAVKKIAEAGMVAPAASLAASTASGIMKQETFGSKSLSDAVMDTSINNSRLSGAKEATEASNIANASDSQLIDIARQDSDTSGFGKRLSEYNHYGKDLAQKKQIVEKLAKEVQKLNSEIDNASTAKTELGKAVENWKKWEGRTNLTKEEAAEKEKAHQEYVRAMNDFAHEGVEAKRDLEVAEASGDSVRIQKAKERLANWEATKEDIARAQSGENFYKTEPLKKRLDEVNKELGKAVTDLKRVEGTYSPSNHGAVSYMKTRTTSETGTVVNSKGVENFATNARLGALSQNYQGQYLRDAMQRTGIGMDSFANQSALNAVSSTIDPAIAAHNMEQLMDKHFNTLSDEDKAIAMQHGYSSDADATTKFHALTRATMSYKFSSIESGFEHMMSFDASKNRLGTDFLNMRRGINLSNNHNVDSISNSIYEMEQGLSANERIMTGGVVDMTKSVGEFFGISRVIKNFTTKGAIDRSTMMKNDNFYRILKEKEESGKWVRLQKPKVSGHPNVSTTDREWVHTSDYTWGEGRKVRFVDAEEATKTEN